MQTRTNTSRGVTDQNGRAAPRSDHRNTARGREGGGGELPRQSAIGRLPLSPRSRNREPPRMSAAYFSRSDFRQLGRCSAREDMIVTVTEKNGACIRTCPRRWLITGTRDIARSCRGRPGFRIAEPSLARSRKTKESTPPLPAPAT